MALHLPAVFVWLYAGDGSGECCRGSGLPQVGTATNIVELRSQPMGGGWPACPQGVVYFKQQQPGASSGTDYHREIAVTAEMKTEPE